MNNQDFHGSERRLSVGIRDRRHSAGWSLRVNFLRAKSPRYLMPAECRRSLGFRMTFPGFLLTVFPATQVSKRGGKECFSPEVESASSSGPHNFAFCEIPVCSRGNVEE